MDRYQVVSDEKELKSFIELISGKANIQRSESFLVNTAFRSKKLSDQERKKLGARNREIYMTKHLRCDHKGNFDTEGAVNKFYELEVPIRALTYNIGTPNEIHLPQYALVCYTCPNPSQETEVALEHLISTVDILRNYVKAVDKANAENQLAHHNTDFRSERSKNVRKVWIDFDIDIANVEEFGRKAISDAIRAAVKSAKSIFKNLEGFILHTAGGAHVLIDKNCLCGNPNIFCEELKKWMETNGAEIKEIDYKSGGFYVPTPGTLQYGKHTVTFEKI